MPLVTLIPISGGMPNYGWKQLKVVATGLSEYDPENSKSYEKNLEEYLTYLRDLDEEILEKMKLQFQKTRESL